MMYITIVMRDENKTEDKTMKISRQKYSELVEMLETAGFERQYTVLAGEQSGSLFVNENTGNEFTWTPKTTEQDILKAVA